MEMNFQDGCRHGFAFRASSGIMNQVMVPEKTSCSREGFSNLEALKAKLLRRTRPEQVDTC